MGLLDSWLWLGVGWGRRGEAAVSAEVGILGLVYIGPAASASSSLLHQAVQILAPHTCLNFALLSQANTPLWAPSQPGAPSTSQILCLSFWNTTVPSHLPSSVGFVCLLTPVHLSISLSFPPSLSLSHLNSSLCLAPLPPSSLPCLVTLLFCLPCPHGLSYRGASTSPTSACHLHTE